MQMAILLADLFLEVKHNRIRLPGYLTVGAHRCNPQQSKGINKNP